MLPATGSGGLINIHCIFNPDETFIDLLEHDFFSSLQDSDGNKMNRIGLIALGKASDESLSEEEAYKRGIEEFHLEPSKMIELFKSKPALKNNTIVVVSNSNSDGASALQQHYKLFENENGSLDAVRRNIYKLSDAIFSSNPTDRDFFLGKKTGCNEIMVIKKCGSLKPCIHGSDAHTEDKLFSPHLNRFCWIKADLTFEGLKQILCEPDDRVRIQVNKPEEKTGYHVLNSIAIDSEICKQNIFFNPNLNTIIGGRSTGKSTLLQIIAHSINPNLLGLKPFISNIPRGGIKIIWQDGEENKDRDIEFFPQSYMYEIARNKASKDKIIQSIVEEKDTRGLIKAFESFCVSNKSRIQNDLDDLFKLKETIDELMTALRGKGDESGLNKEIEILGEKIKECQKADSTTAQDLEAFETLKQEILNDEQLLQKLGDDKAEIAALQNAELFDSSFIYKFNKLTDLNSMEVQDIFNVIKSKAAADWRDKLSVKLNNIDVLIDGCMKNIQQKKDGPVFLKGSLQLNQNKQFKELNDRLTVEKKKFAEINTLRIKVDSIAAQKNNLIEKIIENHANYVACIDKLIVDFSLLHDDIEIKVEKIYLQEKCKELLKDFINLQSYSRQSFVNDWGVNYQADVKSKIRSFLENSLDNKFELKAYKNIKDLAKSLLIENWYSISYDLTFQNDTFDKMSDGKKSFVILKLLLEFSNKECPILIDQPEDSLDNRAIYNELVTYLKQKKKSRQIILVTHNANIVVNADAEQVIVANQHGENSKNNDGIKFQYITGSLENTKSRNDGNIILQSQGVRDHVCEILEGGTEAFKKRENKYSIV
jgi:predicted ATPase